MVNEERRAEIAERLRWHSQHSPDLNPALQDDLLQAASELSRLTAALTAREEELPLSDIPVGWIVASMLIRLTPTHTIPIFKG